MKALFRFKDSVDRARFEENLKQQVENYTAEPVPMPEHLTNLLTDIQPTDRFLLVETPEMYHDLDCNVLASLQHDGHLVVALSVGRPMERRCGKRDRRTHEEHQTG